MAKLVFLKEGSKSTKNSTVNLMKRRFKRRVLFSIWMVQTALTLAYILINKYF